VTPGEAAEVRATAWTPAMRKQHRECPAYTSAPTCSARVSWRCKTGRHATCHLGVPLPNWETVICGKGGVQALGFSKSFTNPGVSATGWHPTTHAAVWLADRLCASRCTCDCGHPAGSVHALHNHPARARSKARPVRYEVVTLPGLDLEGAR